MFVYPNSIIKFSFVFIFSKAHKIHSSLGSTRWAFHRFTVTCNNVNHCFILFKLRSRLLQAVHDGVIMSPLCYFRVKTENPQLWGQLRASASWEKKLALQRCSIGATPPLVMSVSGFLWLSTVFINHCRRSHLLQIFLASQGCLQSTHQPLLARPNEELQ